MESTFSEKLKLMFEIITPYVEDESAVKDLKMKMHDGRWHHIFNNTSSKAKRGTDRRGHTEAHYQCIIITPTISIGRKHEYWESVFVTESTGAPTARWTHPSNDNDERCIRMTKAGTRRNVDGVLLEAVDPMLRQTKKERGATETPEASATNRLVYSQGLDEQDLGGEASKYTGIRNEGTRGWLCCITEHGHPLRHPKLVVDRRRTAAPEQHR
jgi:hypothetical protein